MRRNIEKMSQDELDEYTKRIETKREEQNCIRAALTFAQDEKILDRFDLSYDEFPHLNYREIALTIRNWLNANNLKFLTVKANRIDGIITIRQSQAPKDRCVGEWSPFEHREEVSDHDIFLRIDCGLKEDYIEPDTKHVWHIKDYLAGKTGNGVAVTFGKKFLGMAFRTVSEAAEYAHTRTFESVPHMEKMHKASSSNGSRRYY